MGADRQFTGYSLRMRSVPPLVPAAGFKLICQRQPWIMIWMLDNLNPGILEYFDQSHGENIRSADHWIAFRYPSDPILHRVSDLE
jgi:hypothetical protein